MLALLRSLVRPICTRCGMVNTVTQSGYCVNCHHRQN